MLQYIAPATSKSSTSLNTVDPATPAKDPEPVPSTSTQDPLPDPVADTSTETDPVPCASQPAELVQSKVKRVTKPMRRRKSR